jgi:hypothetical protein
MMHSKQWPVIAEMPNYPEAEVIKLLLESNNVPTHIELSDPINPQAGVYIMVQSDLVHRAKWILKNKGLSDAELNFLATGELSQEQKNNELNNANEQ